MMIDRLIVENFKCFERLNIEMTNLNVFAGINSMGKSTAIQAILLLRQAFEMNSINEGLYLNGNLTNVGTGYDLLYRDSQTDKILIELVMGEDDLKNIYEYSRESDFLKLIDTTNRELEMKGEGIFCENFTYISAERQGPQKYYINSYRDIFVKNQVGVHGEFFPGYIAERGMTDKVVNSKVLHKKIKSDLLIYQMEQWMSEISPGINLKPSKYIEAGIVNLGYSVQNEEYSPMNVGFGLSYVAPIVLALLKAKKGDLVILENPEAHLHPRGQRIMGELIARAAAGGVQIVLETHSDHLLNGIRISVKKEYIDRQKVGLNYFFCITDNSNKLEKKIKHTKCSPVIMNDGSLSDWPDGFFDEWDKALEELF